jgi:hypothetical protein
MAAQAQQDALRTRQAQQPQVARQKVVTQVHPQDAAQQAPLVVDRQAQC